MSVITGLVLVTSANERDAVERVNAWCRENDERENEFLPLDGDDEVVYSRVWALSGNHFPHADLIEALPTFGWHNPRGVVLVVDYEHNDGMVQVYRPDGQRIADEAVGGWAR